MRGVLAGLSLAACYTSSPPTTTEALKNQAAPPVLTINATTFGPLDADTPATLMPLRRVLVGYDVKPVNDGTLEYDIHRDGKRLAYVVPDDGNATIFNIHVVSADVVVAGRPWRVGSPFRGARRLTHCECWGEHPTCYREGEHVAVNFARECASLENVERRALRVLDGLPIQRVIWSPRPFGPSYPADEDEVHEGP